MHIYKHHIDDFIKCNYLFGRNIIHGRNNPIKIIEPFTNIKKHIAEIACYELSNETKLPLAEYRTRYTNKYNNRRTVINDIEKYTKDLNKIFEIFANSIFMAYNVPIDIPIQKTSIIYRDVIDFLVTDFDGNIIAIEIDDLSDIDFYKKKLNEWPHYYAMYSFLASSFEQDIKVIIIDPQDITRLDASFNKDRFDNDIQILSEIVKPIQSNVLVKNLYACDTCDYLETCNSKSDLKVGKNG